MPLIARGADQHPPGLFPEARVVAIELPEDASGSRRESPFGPWLRVLFETPSGYVATMISPAYVPGSDLWLLASLRFIEPLPETIDTNDLLGIVCPIRVLYQREHGALMAVAQLVHGCLLNRNG